METVMLRKEDLLERQEEQAEDVNAKYALV